MEHVYLQPHIYSQRLYNVFPVEGSQETKQLLQLLNAIKSLFFK